eukprot:9498016-Pyramimonas_sp.AAC.1
MTTTITTTNASAAASARCQRSALRGGPKASRRTLHPRSRRARPCGFARNVPPCSRGRSRTLAR